MRALTIKPVILLIFLLLNALEAISSVALALYHISAGLRYCCLCVHTLSLVSKTHFLSVLTF